MSEKFNSLQKKINIKFKNLNYLKKSVTHKSYDSVNNYEKLEFLGDRILGLVISKKLIELYPNEKEGVLDKKLASLVNKNRCLEIAKIIDLEKYIFVGNKNKKNKIETKIVADSNPMPVPTPRNYVNQLSPKVDGRINIGELLYEYVLSVFGLHDSS